MMPLGLLNSGEQGEIVAIRLPETSPSVQCCTESNKCDCRVGDMGLRIGKKVEMLNNSGGGPLLLKVDESRIAVARGIAMKIMITEVTR